MEGLRAAH
jgi:hypothetical protein